MQKLLYVTDQGEYVDHSFIGPLFETYLKKYFHIDIVYFTEFKSDFEKKDNQRFVVPSRYKKSLLKELASNDIDIDQYSYVIIRNDMAILKHALDERKKHNYKLGFRLSFPKRRAQLRLDIARNKASFLDKLAASFRNTSEMQVINSCDFFLPTSQSMHEEFFPEINIKTLMCPAGIDPNQLHENLQHEGEEKRFVYSGTMDNLREFSRVLDAFSRVKSDKWHLTIATQDLEFAQELISKYPNMENKVVVLSAPNKQALLRLTAEADIGIAMLPDIPVFNTSLPIKTLDYYSSAIPCVMTNSAHANRIFTDEHDAWFCKFDEDDIANKIEHIITLSKEEVTAVGQKGQDRLLDIKNYEKIAEQLAKDFENL